MVDYKFCKVLERNSVKEKTINFTKETLCKANI